MYVSHANFTLAAQIYQEHGVQPDSRYIAGLPALACLAELISQHKPKFVTELGGGIGTVTSLVLRHPNKPEHLLTFEDDAKYLARLDAIWAKHRGTLRLTSSLEMMGNTPADMLLVDGGALGPYEGDYECRPMQDGTIVWVENIREAQRAKLTSYANEHGFELEFKAEAPNFLDEPLPGKGCWVAKCKVQSTQRVE